MVKSSRSPEKICSLFSMDAFDWLKSGRDVGEIQLRRSFCSFVVTLFCLKINSIVKALCPGVEFSLYVDDFVICYRSKFIHIIERHLQRCLNKLQHWADTNGFKFSTSKTVCVHFCHLRKLHPDPQLLLYGNPIPVVEKVKFLGIIFDRKLSFLPHLHSDVTLP